MVADFLAPPVDRFLVEVALVFVLLVVDLMLADLALLDRLAVLPDFLVERLFLLVLPSLALPLLLLLEAFLAAPSLPNSLVM